MRYIPNPIKLLFSIKRINIFTANSADTNALINPSPSNIHSFEEKVKPVLTKSSPLAAISVGMPSRKENSTTFFLAIPIESPPIIIAPERDTPGIKARV